MAKIKIKPYRTFFHGEKVLAAGKTVAVEEEDAALFVHHGWAAPVSGKEKEADEDGSPEGGTLQPDVPGGGDV